MADKLATVPDEKLTDFHEIGDLIDRYFQGKRGCLIQVLHTAQGLYGYLPLELQQYIADKLELPLSEVSGVVTFYSFFSTIH